MGLMRIPNIDSSQFQLLSDNLYYLFETPRFYPATAKHTHGIAVEILSVRPSVRPSVRLSNACIVTKRKHLAKKFNYD